MPMTNPYLPQPATVVERIDEASGVFTLRLKLADQNFSYQPGQFNMLYLFGVGEVPISIVSDSENDQLVDHTIRAVGRVTNGMAKLKAGDTIGIRGPYGRGWPMQEAQGKDVIVLTGGLGCAPVVSVIRYIMNRRDLYQRLVIMQGVKHSQDLIWRKQYELWEQQGQTQVLLAANNTEHNWPWHKGYVTNLIDEAKFDSSNCVVMMCGPEIMMHTAITPLTTKGIAEDQIYMSMERNMQCALGHCGHCQFGNHFVCKNGPVFCYPEVKSFMNIKGY